jgi:hypothetical protein
MASCMKCDQPLPPGVAYCAHCGAAQYNNSDLAARERDLQRREQEVERRELGATRKGAQTNPTIVQNIYTGRRKSRGIGCLSLIVLLVIIGAAAAAGSQNGSSTATQTTGVPTAFAGTTAPQDTKAPPPPIYSVTESGSMLKVQQVGEIVTFATTVKNTGSTALPHLVLWFNGIDPWVVDAQTSSCRADEPASVATLNLGSAWDYGQIVPGASCDITITMAARSAGSHSLTWDTYADLDGSGAASKQIDGASYGWQGVINP